MKNKKDRLLLESEVIAAVDKHTNDYNRLDDDITCILEEVNGMNNVEVVDKSKGNMCIKFGMPTQPTVPPMPKVKKKESRFPTIRKVLDKYEDIDSCDSLGEALGYAIYKDLNEYTANVLAECLMSIVGSDLSFNIQTLIIDALENIYGENKE